jgi:hypothetical protein
MTTSIATPPKLQFFDAGGDPLVGGKLYSYAAGTTTPLATYTSSTGNVANTNPVILDSRGEANVWFGAGQYKLKLTSATDVEVWTVDNLNGPDQATLASFSASSGSSLVGFIQSGSGAVATTVQARLRKTFFTSDYDTFVNAVAAAANGTLIVNSTITVSANLTVPSTVDLQVSNEGIFNIATAVTLTINGSFECGIFQAFNCSGSGKVTFNSQFTSVGYPEWWGASTNAGIDATAAITASFLACTVTKLQATDYYVATTLKLDVAGHELIGSGCFYNGVAGDSTRVISLTGTSNVIQLGPDSEPAIINLHTAGMRLQNLQVSRAAAPNIASGCAGVINRWTLYSQIRDVKSVENIYGFYYRGTVAAYTQNCWAFRSSAGTGAGTDFWYGFYIDGLDVLNGASGGNASIYFTDTNSNNVIDLGVNSSGYYVDGAWADTSITNPEATGCAIGINLQGNALGTLNYGETDLNIVKPVIDAFTVAGIYINNTSPYGAISIIGGFAAPSGAGTPTGSIYLNNSLASVSITGFQHVLGPNASITGGLVAINSENIFSSGNSYLECAGIPVSLSGVANSLFMDTAINNGTTASAVVQLTNSSRNKLEMLCSGGSAKFGLGYQGISTGNTYNELNCTGLDSTTINSGSVNKLIWNGTQITVTGLISSGTTNLASGVMG